MLIEAQNRIADLITKDPNSRFILTLSEPERTDAISGVEAMIDLPDKPQKVTLKTIMLKSEYR